MTAVVTLLRLHIESAARRSRGSPRAFRQTRSGTRIRSHHKSVAYPDPLSFS